MPDSQPLPSTKSGPLTDGDSSPNAQRRASRSQSPETIGTRFGRLTVIDAVPVKRNGRPLLRVRCMTCGAEGLRQRDALRRGRAGCRACGHPRLIPKWLSQRCISAKQRCTNPNDRAFYRYGGRGIEFRFESPLEMGLWVQKHLGLHRELELDRVDNNGHYEPDNLRYATPAQNLANSRKQRVSAQFHSFRMRHPEIRYADATLRRFLLDGMTPTQIIGRWHQPSHKPKGVYGTFSTADPVIASQLKGS